MPDEDIPGLGIHLMHGETLKALLWRVFEGEHPEDIFVELWANADHVGMEDLFGGMDE